MLNKIKKALTSGENILVTGSPGSGKTQSLVQTIGYLIREKKTDPSRILVFCFNRRWAKILRDSTALDSPRGQAEIPINTFHSFCLSLLQDYHFHCFLSQLRANQDIQDIDTGVKVLNSTQQWVLLTQVMEGLDPKHYSISRRYLGQGQYIAHSYIQEVFDFILRAQESLLSPRQILDRFNPYKSKALSEIGGIYLKYVEALQQQNSYNYGLLLQHTVKILTSNNGFREKYKKKYDYILFDELHESNRAQMKIIELISRNNCIFWGNDDQSTFSFRGSLSQNFEKVYHNINPKNIVEGRHNFRNGKDINKLAHHFISRNQYRIPKKKSSSSTRGKVVIKDFPNMLEEAQFICEKIKWLRQSLIPLEKIAVIIKGLGYETHIIENALEHNRLPFARRGSRTILDNNEVRYLLNVLKLFTLPPGQAEEQDYLIESIMLSSVLNIKPLLLKTIKHSYREQAEQYPNLLAFLTDNKEYGKTGAIDSFLKSLERFKEKSQEPVFDFLLQLVQDKSLGLAGKPNLSWEGVSDFLTSVRNYNQENPRASISQYLDFLNQVIEGHFIEEIEQGLSVSPLNKVNLLSYHQAKGLEFEAVFVPFLSEGYIPAGFYLPQSYDLQLFSYFEQGRQFSALELKKRHIEDERRLLYSGITRGRKYLYITSNLSRPQSSFFLDLKKIAGSLHINTADSNPGFTLDNANSWQAKRRALVLAYRKQRGLYYSRYKLKKYVDFLNWRWPAYSWWENIKFSDNRHIPFQVFNPTYSYSSLDTYRQCPLKYKFNYFFKIRTPADVGLKIGSLYHLVLQKFFESKEDFSWANLKSIIEELWEQEEFEFKALRKESKTNALNDFERFFKSLMPVSPQDSISEKEFKFYLDNYQIRGKIDQINFVGPDCIELIDYKSSSKKYSDNDLKEEIQLKIYRMALQESPDLNFLKDKKVKLKYISLSNEKNPVAVMPEQYYQKQELKQSIIGIIDNINQENFEPSRDYFGCNNCDFKVFCKFYYG